MRSLRGACGALLAPFAVTGLLSALLAGLPPATAAAAPPVFPAGSPEPAVVVVGVPGLRWSDIQGEIPTPNLWLLARDSALAALSVRTVEPTTCPLDGWLTLNSGARSVGPRPHGACAPVPPPQENGATTTVPDWAALIAPNGDHSYDPVWGTLAGARPGVPATTSDAVRCAVGPGAAVALADAEGRVRATYAADLAHVPAGGCSELLLVDAGVLPAGPERLPSLRRLDGFVEGLRDALPGSALMVAGIADSDPDRAHLSALMVESGEVGLRGLRRGWLRSESTRQTGLVTLTDLTPTLMPEPVPADLDGNPLQYRARIESTPTAVRDMERRDRAAQVVLDVFVPFFTVLIAGQLLLYLAAALALRTGRLDRRR
ncbi:MAG TPA: hypothetical protein VMZ00_06605, partial [Sporichthya sp.]|nr:hypothetical protein [Sporichthya sp.]